MFHLEFSYCFSVEVILPRIYQVKENILQLMSLLFTSMNGATRKFKIVCVAPMRLLLHSTGPEQESANFFLKRQDFRLCGLRGKMEDIMYKHLKCNRLKI